MYFDHHAGGHTVAKHQVYDYGRRPLYLLRGQARTGRNVVRCTRVSFALTFSPASPQSLLRDSRVPCIMEEITLSLKSV